LVKRVVAAIVVVALSVVGCVWHLSGPYVYPDPGECDALRVTAERTPDVVPEMEWRGCPDVPWDKMSSFSPPPSPSAR
jgi:hypothetical protein